MVDVVVLGAAGRMGRRLVALAGAAGCRVVAAIEREDHPDLGLDAGTIAGTGELGVQLISALEAALGPGRVLIDFSLPPSFLAAIGMAARAGTPVVSGTTGIPEEERGGALEEAGRRIPLVWAPNMSVGVNLLFHLVERAARLLPAGFDPEIVEIHHGGKRDAPSGTALELGRLVAGARGWPWPAAGRLSREGEVTARSKQEVGIAALRGGEVVGEHSVLFLGPGERIELGHRAASRDIFVRGALLAATWVVDRPAGVYGMADVLGLE